jgi:hypothetical protein
MVFFGTLLRERKEASLVDPERRTERDLLEQISRQLAAQQADIDTIRYRTGCLYAWLILTLIFGFLAFLVMRS